MMAQSEIPHNHKLNFDLSDYHNKFQPTTYWTISTQFGDYKILF